MFRYTVLGHFSMTRFFPLHFPDNSLTVNNIPDISLTCFKFPDISRFSRQVVTLFLTIARRSLQSAPKPPDAPEPAGGARSHSSIIHIYPIGPVRHFLKFFDLRVRLTFDLMKYKLTHGFLLPWRTFTQSFVYVMLLQFLLMMMDNIGSLGGLDAWAQII